MAGEIVGGGVFTSEGSIIGEAGGGPDNAIARWDGTDEIQGSGVLLDDARHGSGWASVRIDPTGWLQIGTDPGGATPVPSVGHIRLHAGADIYKDDGSGNPICVIQGTGTTGFYVGKSGTGPDVPYFVGIGAIDNMGLAIGGFAEVFVDTTGLYLGWMSPFTEIGNNVLRYWWASGPFDFGADVDPTAGAVGRQLTSHGQDVSGTGAVIGGARLDRAGDATAAGTGGAYDLRPGAGGVGGALRLINGQSVPQLLVDDSGMGVLSALHMHDTQVSAGGATYTVSAGDLCLLVDTTGAPTAVQLPAAASSPGRIIWICDDSGLAGSSAITVRAATGDTINGAPSYIIRLGWEAVCLKCNDAGSSWHVIAHNP